MFKIKVNDKFEHEVQLQNDNLNLNGEAFLADIVKHGTNSYHVLHNQQSYNVEVVSLEHARKNSYYKSKRQYLSA